MDRPILFSAPMVRALLAGTKTQTRRALRTQPPADVREFCTFHNPKGPGVAHFAFDPVARELREWFTVCPYGQPGDRLWVRETVRYSAEHANHYWAADNQGVGNAAHSLLPKKAVPSIHMPRAASRLTLEIIGVRVERLQDISEADSITEGVERTAPGDGWRRYADPAQELAGVPPCATARDSYRSLWEQINGAGSWDANPWVWVVEFRRADMPGGPKA